MSLGSAIRSVLGNRLSRWVGYYYRAAFVDLGKVAQAFSANIPANSHVLDVGGGDGVPLNYLLDLRTDLTITSIDLAPVVGQWLNPKYAGRVVRIPGTNLNQYIALGQPRPDVLLLSDVMHHIPKAERRTFFTSVSALLQLCPRMKIIVKDVEPGSIRSVLGYWADKYITGDKSVSPISRGQLISLVKNTLGPMSVEETELFAADKPNYALVFFR